MTKALWVVMCVALLAGRGAVAAELVRDLYAAEVPVADQSSNALSRAAAEALAQVLVKVSGSVEVLLLAPIEQALEDARKRVRQYSYIRIEPSSGSTTELAARLEFDPAQVRELLAGAGAPIWTATRPAVLIWLVIEDGYGRRFVNPDMDQGLLAGLVEGFQRRGVPVRLPLFDLTDTTALDPDEAWGLSTNQVLAASERYRATEILVGRIAVLASGEIAGDWAYLSGNGRQDRGVVRTSTSEFVDIGVAMVAEDMASRFALVASGAASEGLVMMVSGVTRYADYAAVLSWLEGLEPIARAQVVGVTGDTLSLLLEADADVAQLAGIIELNPRLLPGSASAPGGLNYRWRN